MLEYAALVGIDRADAKHDVCLLDCASGKRESGVVKHTPEDLNRWADVLRQRYPGQKIAVCLEQARGPLVYALLKYDFLVIYPVNPKTLAKFREAFTTSRAKDDPGDAEYLADLLALHRDKLRAWLPDDEKTRTLQYLVEHRRRLVGDRSRSSNRLTSLLKGYFPQVLDWFPDPRNQAGHRLPASLAVTGLAQASSQGDAGAVLPPTPVGAQAGPRTEGRADQGERPAGDG